MTFTDEMAKAVANRKVGTSGYLLPLFVSRSAALSEIKTIALKEWHTFLGNLEDKDEKIFRKESGFKPFANARMGSTFLRLRPPKWFKAIDHPTMSQLTQMCTNHAPTGEYFKHTVWTYQDKPSSFYLCPYRHKNHPPSFQTRDHIIRVCPLFDDTRDRLRKVFPRINRPSASLGRMTKKKVIESTLDFLRAGPFSRKHAPYEPP